MRTRFPKLPQALRVGVVVAGLLQGGGASALGLLQAYEAALQNDAQYRSATFDAAAGKEYQQIGRSSLLPSLSAGYSGSKNRTDVTTEGRDVLGRPATSLTHPEYFSRVRNVQLRQPLFSMEAYARYKQGLAQSAYSEAVFSSQGQELVMRVLSAYVDALFGNELVALARAQRDMYQEQKKVNDSLLKLGEGTRTDVLETTARLDLAEAQLTEALDAQVASRQALSAIIGTEVDTIEPLAADFRVMAMQPSTFEAWRDLALAHNPDLLAQDFAIESSRQEINKARSGHTPRVDLVASYSKNDSDTLNTYTQQSTVRSIGFQINIPLYSGGYVNAVSRQTAAAYEKAKAEKQNKIDKVLLELRKQFSQAGSSSNRIEALTKAVDSGKLLMAATEQSIKGGVRINLDLLNAKQQWYTSQRDLAQAKYAYVLAAMRLRAAAGILSASDVHEVAASFH